MYLGIDIGGSKVLLAVFGKDSPRILEQQRFETPKDYHAFISALEASKHKLNNTNFTLVVAGVPGRLDRVRGTALAFGTLPWTDVPIAADLKRIFNTDVVIENDSKLAGLSEALLLKDKYSKVLYVTIGTGISSALVVDGKLNPETIDSESGQITIEYEGKMQNWEDIASGRVFAEMFGKKVRDVTDTAQLQIIAHNIGLGLINLLPVLTPDVVVLGGGVGANLDKFQAQLERELQKYANSMFTIPPILKAQEPEQAVIYGCWKLAKQSYEKSNQQA